MQVVDFFGHAGTGKSTIMSKIDDKDVAKWIDLPPIKKSELLKHLLRSRFFWRNILLILRVSLISRFHGKRRRDVRKKIKNLEIILHFIYNAERFAKKGYKFYLVEKGPISTLPTRANVRERRIIEKFMDRVLEIYPHSILYFYSDTENIIKNMKKRSTKTDVNMIKSNGLRRNIEKKRKDMRRNFDFLGDKLVHLGYIKSDERDIEGNVKKVKDEMRKIRKKLGFDHL